MLESIFGEIPPDLSSPNWAGIGVRVNIVLTITTISLVLIAFFQLIVFWRLQSGLNRFAEQSEVDRIRNNQEALQRSRLIELSREWNSPELLLSRIRADMYFESSGADATVKYEKDNLELWHSLSLIVHFF